MNLSSVGRLARLLGAGLLCLGMALPLRAQDAPGLPESVLQALQKAGVGAESVGLWVQDSGSGAVLASANAQAVFSPASVIKLLTTAAALDLLGPSHTWQTRAYADGALAGDVLHGNLILQGGGDPKLVVEKFWLFLRRIRAAGIREIRGNLILDRSLFEAAAEDPGAFDGQPARPYNVDPDALLVNFKSFQYRFMPDPASGQVRLGMEPYVADLAQAPRLSRAACGDWPARLEPEFSARGIRLQGSYAASCGDKTWYAHPWRMGHAQYVDLVFRQLWTELGGSLKGAVVDGALPQGARLVAEWESPPLAEVVRDINKYSNNVMARQLLLTLAAQDGRLPANPRRGGQVVAEWLAEKRIAAPGLVLDNGSGLSRHEAITPRTLGQVLLHVFQGPVMPEMLASLPLVGLDGSMKRRLRDQAITGQAHIKTGSLEGVRAVAGYVLAASGKRYVVVCMVNHAKAAGTRAALDALLQWVYEVG